MAQSINLNQWLVNFKKDFIEINNLNEDQLELINLSDNKLISFDASHLTQVITNLCLNSITHNNHPPESVKITIKYNYDEDYEQPYLDISDNGPGINADIIEKIFDPFFTTSTTGTGLGLYITKEMIESNRGRILYSKSSSGEKYFRIFFINALTHT